MTTVVSYLSSLPIKTKPNSDKSVVLRAFAQGVLHSGDTGIVCMENKYIESDVGVILGWVHEQGKKAPHLQLRKQLVETYTSKQNHTVIIDSNLFLYADRKNPHQVLRYSFDHIFPGQGNYCDKPIDPARWQHISKLMGISVKPYRKNGNHILLCLQRDGGWSMGATRTESWASRTILTLRRISDRPIVIRNHPGDKRSDAIKQQIRHWAQAHNIKQIIFSDSNQRNLVEDLQSCWAVVNHNSSPTVGAAIEGVPVFVTDVSRSQCAEIANTDLATIESPREFDRENWLCRLAMFHWSLQEIRDGSCWRHMRKYL